MANPGLESGGGQHGLMLPCCRVADGRRSVPNTMARHAVKKIAFVSPHCVLDFTNGAATATLDGFAAGAVGL